MANEVPVITEELKTDIENAPVPTITVENYEITFLLANVGIDYWDAGILNLLENEKGTIPNFFEYVEHGNHFEAINQIHFKNKLKKIESQKVNKKDPYQYSCFFDNKLFDEYLKQLHEFIQRKFNSDVYIYQEFCVRDLKLYNLFSYFIQHYGYPKDFDLKTLTEKNKQESKKSFFTGSSNEKINVIPYINSERIQFLNKVGDKSEYRDDTGRYIFNGQSIVGISGDAKMYFGNIQCSMIKCNTDKIFLINVHNRFYYPQELLDSILNAADLFAAEQDVIILGDFNNNIKKFVAPFRELSQKLAEQKYKHCDQLNSTCNLSLFFPKDYPETADYEYKRKKKQNMQIFYRLNNFDLELTTFKSENIIQTSSHNLIQFKLKRKNQHAGYKRYKLVK